MAKPGRNDPCLCGSGKKYKRCCLERDEATAAVASTPFPVAKPTQPLGWIEDDDLEEVSNSVIDLLAEGKLDQAERACHELRERYPGVHDWMERLGQVQEARGNYAEAAQHYQQAADFVEGREGYDPEVGEWLRPGFRGRRQTGCKIGSHSGRIHGGLEKVVCLRFRG